MSSRIPSGYINYLSTKEFTEDTIPDSLLKRHNTKNGSWGKIVILEGELIYRILEPVEREMILSPDRPGIVEPQIYHKLITCGPVRFRIDFFKNV